jgi:hypothetical protein
MEANTMASELSDPIAYGDAHCIGAALSGQRAETVYPGGQITE